MISYEIVIAELAKHLATAQSVKSEARVREELSAIRALCDVALHNEVIQPSPNINIPQGKANTLHGVPQQTSTPLASSLTQNKLEEEDANGDSIFDF